MAYYNIAANQRNAQPVDNFLRARAATDRHELAQQQITQNEIEEPYIKTLLDQKVERGQQEIDRETTEAKFRKEALERRRKLEDQQIQRGENQLKEQTRQQRFLEDIGQLSDEELRAEYPDLAGKYFMGRAAETETAIASITEQLDFITAMPEDQRQGAYEQALGQLPPEVAEQMPPYYSEEFANNVRRNMDNGRRSTIDSLIDNYEYYKDKDPAMADALRDQLVRKSAGNVGSTQKERLAEAMFGDYDNPMVTYMEYDRLDKLYQKSLATMILQEVKMSENDILFNRDKGFVGVSDAGREFLASDEGQIRMAELANSLSDNALMSLGEDMSWYINARNHVRGRRGGDSPTIQQQRDVPAQDRRFITQRYMEVYGREPTEEEIRAAFEARQQ